MSLDDLTTRRTTSPSQILKRKKSYAWLLPVGLVLGFMVVLALLFGGRLLPATPVKTAPVITIRAGEELGSKRGAEEEVRSEKGDLEFQASGWVEPDPYTVYVTALINGVVEEVYVLEGQEVKKGELVATLINEDAELNLQSAKQKYIAFEKRIVAHCTEHGVLDAEVIAARGKVTALKAQLNEARDDSDRLGRLAKGAVSEKEVIQSRLITEKQAAILVEAEAEIPRLRARKLQIDSEQENMQANLEELAIDRDRAQLALDRTQIKSSMDGVVLRLHAAPGKKRMLDMDDPLSAVIVELYNPKKLQARIDVPLNEAAGLSVGQSVEMVSDLLPNRIFKGMVTRISGQADLQRNTLQAKVEISDPDARLRPDMLVRAKFYSVGGSGVASESSSAGSSAGSGRLSIYVPEDALVNEGSGAEVWVVTTDLRAEKRSIKVGDHSKENHRLVLDGLRSGESVILPPHDELKSGGRVKIIK